MIHMITLDDLHKKYGADIVFLFKGQEPFTEMLGSPGGVLIEHDDKVLCYICETWHESLGNHLHQQHDIKADDYKEMYGFNRNAPLCSRKFSQGLRERSWAAIDKDPSIHKKTSMGRKKAFEVRRSNGHRISPKRLQASNARNTCPEQIKQRYRMLQLKYGNDVSLNVIRKVDSGVEAWAVRNCGSWNKFKELLGDPVDTSSYAKNTADLIYDLREYIDQYGRRPWDVYTKKALNDFPHSETGYINRFGNMTNAFLVAGITNKYEVIDGKARKTYWIEAPVDKKYLDMANRSINRIVSSPYAVRKPGH